MNAQRTLLLLVTLAAAVNPAAGPQLEPDQGGEGPF